MTVPTNTRMLDAALEYAALNWHIVPLWEPAGPDTCSCPNGSNPDPELRCSSVGKHPRTMHGLSDATTDVDTITRWWAQWPKANIGVNCGKSGLIVIDIDPRHGGDEDWRDCQERYGQDITATVTAITGGGGEHYVFTAPQGYSVGNISNSDRYVGPLGRGVDVRASGGYFVAPPSRHASGKRYEWDASPFDTKPARVPLPLLEVLSTPPSQNGNKEPISAARILEGVQEGGRDWALFQLASKLRYADVPIDMAYYLIEQAALNCKPPFPRAEARDKVNSAYKRYEPGAGAFVGPDDVKHAEGLTGRVLLGKAMKEGVPETPWVIADTLVHGRIHMVYGEPESGKTIIALSWVIICISRGEHVLYIDEEGGESSIARLLSDMGADPDLVDQYVHYFPFPGIDKPGYPALIDYTERLNPAVVLFDSLTDMLSVSGLDENSGIEVTGWMLEVATAVAKTPALPAVVLIDHVPKDTNNIRYSVASRAKKAKSDVLWYVEKQADFDQTKTAAVDLHRHKNRPGSLPKFIRYIVGGEDGKLICHPFDATQDVISALSAGAEQMLEALRDNEGAMSPGHLAKLFGKHHDTIQRWGTELMRNGYVTKDGTTSNALYQLSASESQLSASESPNFPENSPDPGLSLEPGRRVSSWAQRAHRIYKEEDWEK